MDILCPRCGEPWDTEEFYDNDYNLSFAEAVKSFCKEGCSKVFNVECDPDESFNQKLQPAYDEALSLCGDDVGDLILMLSELPEIVFGDES